MDTTNCNFDVKTSHTVPGRGFVNVRVIFRANSERTRRKVSEKQSSQAPKHCPEREAERGFCQTETNILPFPSTSITSDAMSDTEIQINIKGHRTLTCDMDSLNS